MHSTEMHYSTPVGKLALQIELTATMCEALSATSFWQDALNNFIKAKQANKLDHTLRIRNAGVCLHLPVSSCVPVCVCVYCVSMCVYVL